MLATEDTENTEERIKIKLSGLCELGGEETNMEMKKSTRYSTGRLMAEMRDTRYENGSALILVVVLTSLLAIVGVMFVMVARVDRIATSAISENKTLDSAVEAVIARISQELVLDVPHNDPFRPREEYYDYPDAKNAWLASLEPYEKTAGNYYWRQISDVTGFLEKENWGTQDIEITNSPLDDRFKAIIEDHKRIELEDDGDLEEQLADADGDGVADSRWIELEGINSSKGKTIYAAVRVIDNGGMLNVNTVYADPGVPDQRKGDKLTDIYIDGLVKTGTNDITKFLDNRGNFGDAQLYHDEVSRRIENPDTTTGHQYSLYDISDELELRNRYMVFNKSVFTRLESKDPPSLCFGNSLRHDNLWTPVDDPCAFKSWKRHVDPDHPDNLGLDPNESDNLYSFRKLLTTYNFDRIINPYGGKMVNVNKADKNSIYEIIRDALADPNFKNVDKIAAQIAVNLIDFSDTDSNVATFDPPPPGGKTYYGFEQPCVYISELTRIIIPPPFDPPWPFDEFDMSYAIELYKPYTEDEYPNQWRIDIPGYTGPPIPTIDWTGTKRFHVIYFENSNAPLTINFDPDTDPNLPPGSPISTIIPVGTGTIVFAPGRTISLQRQVGPDWITVDAVQVPPVGGWLTYNTADSIQRDIQPHKCIRRLWDSNMRDPNLGHANSYVDPSDELIQAHPENEPFTNVGEIGMVFRKDVYDDAIVRGAVESDIRLNLADPDYHNLFQYLTVFDPTQDTIDNDGYGVPDDSSELKIPGRININTAPWYVIAQLPWVSYDEDNPGTADYRLAQAIVAYRDKLDMDPNGPDYYHDGANDSRYQETGIRGLREADGFASIGELATVVNDSGEDEYSMHYYELDSNDLEDFPDLTPSDDAKDDFEERDVIFARLSNLVTVRSDVFTAYILVRIGADGPQKRVMAILDRSNVYTDDGRVQIVALHPVADPR